MLSKASVTYFLNLRNKTQSFLAWKLKAPCQDVLWLYCSAWLPAEESWRSPGCAAVGWWTHIIQNLQCSPLFLEAWLSSDVFCVLERLILQVATISLEQQLCKFFRAQPSVCLQGSWTRTISCYPNGSRDCLDKTGPWMLLGDPVNVMWGLTKGEHIWLASNCSACVTALLCVLWCQVTSPGSSNTQVEKLGNWPQL